MLITLVAIGRNDRFGPAVDLGLAAPFLAAAIFAVAMWRPADGVVRLDISPLRAVEGDEIAIEVTVSSTAGIDRLELEIEASERLSSVGNSLRAVTRVLPGQTRQMSFAVTADEWGVARV